MTNSTEKKTHGYVAVMRDSLDECVWYYTKESTYDYYVDRVVLNPTLATVYTDKWLARDVARQIRDDAKETQDDVFMERYEFGVQEVIINNEIDFL